MGLISDILRITNVGNEIGSDSSNEPELHLATLFRKYCWKLLEASTREQYKAGTKYSGADLMLSMKRSFESGPE